jgi:hypothetical protein
MDLVTLVAMCSIGFDPEAMRSLIWQQSNGNPWSFSLPNDATPRAFGTLQEAVPAARVAQGEHGTVRVGLTGLEVDLKAATAEPNEALFAMCPNVTIASERLRRMQDRCAREPLLGADPTWCAVAVWRGSSEQPDRRFADAVMLGVALGNVPNPVLPSETDDELRSRSTRKTQRKPIADGAMSSALFPPSNDARHPSNAPQSTLDGMFVRRNRRQ